MKEYNLGIEATLEISWFHSKGLEYNQMPPKVEYSITEYGITANQMIDAMCS